MQDRGQGKPRELAHDDYVRVIGQATLDLYRAAEQCRREAEGAAAFARSLHEENAGLKREIARLKGEA